MILLRPLCTYPLILWLLCFSSWFVYAGEVSENGNANPSLEAELEQLTTSVYCYCGCTRETIQHCVCGTAQQVEDDFRNRLAAGGTVKQIRDDYIATYGTQYFALMPPTGFNLVAYIMPVVIIVVLGGVVFLVIRSKMGSSTTTQPAPVQTSESVSEDVQKQIEAELERVKQQR